MDAIMVASFIHFISGTASVDSMAELRGSNSHSFGHSTFDTRGAAASTDVQAQ
jgi:hypothetical protein